MLITGTTEGPHDTILGGRGDCLKKENKLLTIKFNIEDNKIHSVIKQQT